MIDLAGSALRCLDPETAHRLAIGALKTGLVPSHRVPDDPKLRVTLWDRDFPNPVGLAAGFDKNAEAPDALLKLGFGFVEVGTVTPRPQQGNPRPRLFRLPSDQAVINRMGFNNDGLVAVTERLAARDRGAGLVGVNIGTNKESNDRIGSYETGIAALAPHADYLAINVSSPNTPGLRDLQGRDHLRDLLKRCLDARDIAAERAGRSVPLLLKIAPDIDDAQMDDIAAESLAAPIDGLIVTNTTLDRTGLADPRAGEAGGVSGRPLFRRATIVLARMRRRLGPDMPIIGVGGIDSAETAWTKFAAGANLVQIYTGMIYHGPGLPARIIAGLSRRLHDDRLDSVTDLVATDTDHWAAMTP